MEQCFRGDETQKKKPEEEKCQDGSSVPLRKEEEITLNSNIPKTATNGYICSKGLLFQIKEEVYKIITKHSQMMKTALSKKTPIRSLILSWGQCTVEI